MGKIDTLLYCEEWICGISIFLTNERGHWRKKKLHDCISSRSKPRETAATKKFWVKQHVAQVKTTHHPVLHFVIDWDKTFLWSLSCWNLLMVWMIHVVKALWDDFESWICQFEFGLKRDTRFIAWLYCCHYVILLLWLINDSHDVNIWLSLSKQQMNKILCTLIIKTDCTINWILFINHVFSFSSDKMKDRIKCN